MKPKHSPQDPPMFAIRMKGPRVGEKRVSAADLAEIVRRTQQALKRVGQVLYGESSAGQGRKRKDIEQLCELFMVGWERGSAVAEFELAEPPEQLDLFGYMGEESLKAFAAGMAEIRGGARAPSSLPAGFDAGVLQTCDELGKVLDHGIHSITFESRNGAPGPSVIFDVHARQRVRELLERPPGVSGLVKIGRLEELNGHGGLTGRLWEANRTRWMCYFKDEHRQQLPDAWLRVVQLTGNAVVTDGKERIFHVESMRVLEDEIPDSAAPARGASFWRSASVDELIEQQHVAPVTDLDELSALWPVDDDPDALLAHVMSEREAHRSDNDEGGGA